MFSLGACDAMPCQCRCRGGRPKPGAGMCGAAAADCRVQKVVTLGCRAQAPNAPGFL